MLDATYAQLDWFMAKRDPELSYVNSRAAELSYVNSKREPELSYVDSKRAELSYVVCFSRDSAELSSSKCRIRNVNRSWAMWIPSASQS